MFDPNDQDICNYKRIQVLCKEHNIPFRNQSFNQVIDALKIRNFDKSTTRHVFTKEERKQFYEESPECNHCKNSVTKSKFQLDQIKVQIKALVNGGTNHHDNTKSEKKQGDV